MTVHVHQARKVVAWILGIAALSTPVLYYEITNHGQRPWYEAGPPEGAVNVR
jgi:hypothetical protein